MRLTHWIFLIIFVVIIGCLQVTMHNAVVFKSYALGNQWQSVHQKKTEVAWLDARVLKLTSPTHLAEVARKEKMQPIIRLAGTAGSVVSSPVRIAARVHDAFGE